MAELEQAPEWFRTVVAEGIAKLYILRLEGAPAADTLEGVEMVWLETLWNCGKGWDEAQDAARIRRGFVVMARRCSRWPAPGELLTLLPPRPQKEKLPSPERTERERQTARRSMNTIKHILGTMSFGGSDGQRPDS